MSIPQLRKEDSGVYYAKWTDGRRSKRKSMGTRDAAEAQARFAQWLLMGGASQRPEDAAKVYTVADLWAVYEDQHVRHHVVSKGTHRFSWNNLKPHFGHLLLAEVTDAVPVYVTKRARGQIGGASKPATIRRELAILRACFNWCSDPTERKPIISRADVPGFALPADSEPRDRWLKEDEIKRLLAAAEAGRAGNRLSRVERFLWLALETAGRKQALLDLTWDRVDLELGEIDTSWQLQPHQKKHGCGQPQDGGWPCGFKRVSFCPRGHWEFPPGFEWQPCEGTLIFTRPKSAAGIRRIPLTPGMLAALKILKAKDGRNPHNLVFHHSDGKPISQDQDQKSWKHLLELAGVEHVGQHVMRDSCATLLMEAGVDGHIVQSILGHSDVVTTRGYQHVNLALARSALTNLNGLIPGESP
jgi:integrase